jgi:hypothetical protein
VVIGLRGPDLGRIGGATSCLAGAFQVRIAFRPQLAKGHACGENFEVLIVDDEVKIAIQERAPALQLQRILERHGEASLFEKAVPEAVAGVISLEEACKFREVGSTVSLE